MSKKYLFIGGPKDGERLCTNGVPEVRIPMTYSDENSSPVPDSSFHECRYALHESFAPGGRKIAFYALNGLHFVDALQMLIDNYQPKPVVSGEEVDWNKKIDWAKEPERMAEKINFVNVHESWLTNGDELAKRVFQLPTSTVLVFEHLIDAHRVLDMKTKLGAPVISYIESGDFLIFSHRWCIKGQEKVIYPEGE